MSDVTISQMLAMITEVHDHLIDAMTDEDIRVLQRFLRGMSKTQWLEARRKLTGLVNEFIAMTPEDRVREFPDRLNRALLKLVSWQMCVELRMLFLELDEIPEIHSKHPHLLSRRLVGAAVFSLQLVERGALLWPFHIGSPFVEGS